MSVDNDPLCCCEYFDVERERNHILACCCNCQDLDQSFDSVIRGQHPTRCGEFMTTLLDRLRIPWPGGALKIPLDVILPLFLLPTTLLLATISLRWTVGAFTFTFFLLFYFYYSTSALRKTNFFLVWALVSLFTLYSVFEMIVVPFLEIFVHENVSVSMLIVVSVLCMRFVQVQSKRIRKLAENDPEIGESKTGTLRSHYCAICKYSVPEQDYHCIWLNSCIGVHNRFIFLAGVTLLMDALFYSANLTLTSVCHPFRVFKSILLPDNCSDVYEQFELSLSFVSAIYSIVIGILLCIFVVFETLLITFGLTEQEWKALPFLAKLCCGFTAPRPYNKGILNNWLRTMCYWKRSQTWISHY